MRKEYTLELLEHQESNEKEEKLIVKEFQQEDMMNHDHHFFELVYITKGTAVHTLNHQISKLSKGDYFIIDYGSVHGYAKSKNLELINCLFLPEVIDGALKGCRSFEELLHVCLLKYYKFYLGKTLANQIFHDEEERVLELINGMMEEYQKKLPGYIEIFKCRLLEILIVIMRNMIDEHGITSDSSVVMLVMDYIKEHYQQHKILDGFCKTHHFTPQYISRKFKQETGVTLVEYLQRVRMEKCCELLIGSDLPIAEVAMEVGYQDMKFFHQLFRRFYKMTPREYRKLNE